MVKYADIAKNQTKPFSDDFESKVKCATKIAHADGKTSTTLKWDNGITAKVETKGDMNLPVVNEEVSLKQTVEFTQDTYSLTSEFNKACTNFQAAFKSSGKAVNQEFTLRQALGPITAIANYNVPASGDATWKVNAAHEAECSPELNCQVGAEVNDAFKPSLSFAALAKGLGSFAFKTDLARHGTAAHVDLPDIGCPYVLKAGLQASHSADAPLINPEFLVVAKGKDHTIKAKVTDVTGAAVPSVSYITKAPMAMTATWTYKNNASAFGVNVSL